LTIEKVEDIISLFSEPLKINWTDFTTFCTPYLVGVDPRDKSFYMNALLPIFKAFPTEESRVDFITFCASYLENLNPPEKTSCMNALLPIFKDKTLLSSFQSFKALHRPYGRDKKIKSFLHFCFKNILIICVHFLRLKENLHR
jgi:hypothetical protein